MEKLKFSNVIVGDFGRSGKGAIGHVKFVASLTTAVCQKLGWPDASESFATTEPDTELTVSLIELEPKDATLAKKSTLELTVNSAMKGFKIVRREMEGKRGKGFRFDINFGCQFGDESGCRKLEEYIMKVGKTKANLTLHYEKAAVQESLIPDDAKATEDQKQRVLGEAE